MWSAGNNKSKMSVEQMLCKSFLIFYKSDKKKFFEKKGYQTCREIHCNDTVVIELSKIQRALKEDNISLYKQ